MFPVDEPDYGALAKADAVIVGTWCGGLFFFGQHPGGAGKIAGQLPDLWDKATFAFVTWLPSDPDWGLQAEFAAILGPVWRIVLASIAAEVVSELLDTEIYMLWVRRIAVRYRWARPQWLQKTNSACRQKHGACSRKK